MDLTDKEKEIVRRRKNIPNAEELYILFTRYAEENKEQVMWKNVYNQKLDKVQKVEQKVPMTWEGFSKFLRKENIIRNLYDYKANTDGAYGEYQAVLKEIGENIFDEQYCGAAVGNYNAGIVARKLKLADRTEVNTTPTIKIVDMTGKL